jgi:predicted choloylglycine hydrolase
MNNQIEIFELEGNDREMGYKQGLMFKTQIKQLFENLTKSKEFLSSKPVYVPKFIYRKLATIFSLKMIRTWIKDYFPSQWEFLKGLSEGAEISMNKILFIQAIDALGTLISNYKIEEGISSSFNNCSAVGNRREKTTTGGVLIIKNWDGPEFLAKYTLFRKIKPTSERYSTIGSGLVGLGAINNGMNEKGLSIVYNYAYPK